MIKNANVFQTREELGEIIARIVRLHRYTQLCAADESDERAGWQDAAASLQESIRHLGNASDSLTYSKGGAA